MPLLFNFSDTIDKLTKKEELGYRAKGVGSLVKRLKVTQTEYTVKSKGRRVGCISVCSLSSNSTSSCMSFVCFTFTFFLLFKKLCLLLSCLLDFSWIVYCHH